MIQYTMTPKYTSPFSAGMTRADIREAYREAAKLYHPDLHGPEYTEAMQALNRDYTAIMDGATRQEMPNRSENSYNWQRETNERIRAAIEAAIAAARINPAIRIEICSWWVWVWNTAKRSDSAEAAAVCDLLGKAGYKWGKAKNAFYFAGIPSSNRRESPMDEIRNRYGSRTINTDDTSAGPKPRAESVPLFS